MMILAKILAPNKSYAILLHLIDHLTLRNKKHFHEKKFLFFIIVVKSELKAFLCLCP